MHFFRALFLAVGILSVTLTGCSSSPQSAAPPTWPGENVVGTVSSTASPSPGQTSWPCAIQVYTTNGTSQSNASGTCGTGNAPSGAVACQVTVPGQGTSAGWCLLSSSPAGGGPALPAEYIALGDSLTVGMGTSACPPIVCMPITTPASAGISNPSPTTPANGGYAQTFAVQLARARAPIAFTFDALGVTYALTGGAHLPEVQGDILTNPSQIPNLPSIVSARAQGGKTKLLITLWIGSDDVVDATAAAQCRASGRQPTGGGITKINPCNSADTTLTGANGDVRGGSFYAGYKAVLGKIAALNPDALIVMGIVDLSRTPSYQGDPTQAMTAQNCVTANTVIQAALADAHIPNATFLDLYKYYAANPQYYGSAYFASDGFHPNDQGYATIMQQLSSTFTTAFPNF